MIKIPLKPLRDFLKFCMALGAIFLFNFALTSFPQYIGVLVIFGEIALVGLFAVTIALLASVGIFIRYQYQWSTNRLTPGKDITSKGIPPPESCRSYVKALLEEGFTRFGEIENKFYGKEATFVQWFYANADSTIFASFFDGILGSQPHITFATLFADNMALETRYPGTGSAIIQEDYEVSYIVTALSDGLSYHSQQIELLGNLHGKPVVFKDLGQRVAKVNEAYYPSKSRRYFRAFMRDSLKPIARLVGMALVAPIIAAVAVIFVMPVIWAIAIVASILLGYRIGIIAQYNWRHLIAFARLL